MEYFNQIKVKLHHVSPLLMGLLCNSPEMLLVVAVLNCIKICFALI